MTLTDVAAWFGAAGALAAFGSLGFDIYKHHNDKGKLHIELAFNKEILEEIDGQFRNAYPDTVFWNVIIRNTGTKPLIITHLSFEQKNSKKNLLLTKDINGRINKFSLESGDNYTYTIGYDTLDPTTVNKVIVQDAAGRLYKRKFNAPKDVS